MRCDLIGSRNFFTTTLLLDTLGTRSDDFTTTTPHQPSTPLAHIFAVQDSTITTWRCSANGGPAAK